MLFKTPHLGEKAGLFGYGRRASRGSVRKMGTERPAGGGRFELGPAVHWVEPRRQALGVPGPGATYSGLGEGSKKAVSPGQGLCRTSDPI